MDESALMAFLGAYLVVVLVIIVLLIVSYWKIFEKAGKPGWAAIVPIYNVIVLLEIIKKPWWWLLLMMIPYVGIVWNIWSTNLLVKRFGKTEGFTVGCILLPFIFFPILAFDKSAVYQDDSINEMDQIGTQEN